MSNLIITIVSIALIAVAAVMAIYYGGVAYEQGQTDAIANAIMNDSQQMLTAERLYASIHGCQDISCMWIYGASTAGTGISGLVADKELSTWPRISTFNTTPETETGQHYADASGAWAGAPPANASFDDSCSQIGGYSSESLRVVFSVNGQNYVSYWLNGGPCDVGTDVLAADAADASHKNNPVVKVATAINKATGQVPTGATMWAVGLPIGTGSYLDASLITYSAISNDPHTSEQNSFNTFSGSTKTIPTNFCYIGQHAGFASPSIICVFGPS